MRPLYRNLFLLFGIIALSIMVYCFPEGLEEVCKNPKNVLIYLPGAVAIWGIVYLLNSWAFQILVNITDHDKHLSLLHSYKLSISAFAFTSTTPFGSGGGPYRVMELAKHIGMPQAVSSVTLFSIMHIFSHFVFWTTGCIVFLCLHHDKMTIWLRILMGIYLAIFILVSFLFVYSYKKGIISKLFHVFFIIPFLRKPAKRFYERHEEAFKATDANIRILNEHPKELWTSLIAEYVARVINSFEYYFILLALGFSNATFGDALIILAFASLIGNVLFFLPMQIGAREGSLAIIIGLLYHATPYGVTTSIFTRVRETFWVLVGVILVKIGNKSLMNSSKL